MQRRPTAFRVGQQNSDNTQKKPSIFNRCITKSTSRGRTDDGLRTVPINSKTCFAECAGKAGIEIQNEDLGLIIQQYLQKALKYKAMYDVLFQIELS